jgi:hypothetical protein
MCSEDEADDGKPSHPIFPPAHEQFDPTLILWKAVRDLHLFAARDPSMNAPGVIKMRWIKA